MWGEPNTASCSSTAPTQAASSPLWGECGVNQTQLPVQAQLPFKLPPALHGVCGVSQTQLQVASYSNCLQPPMGWTNYSSKQILAKTQSCDPQRVPTSNREEWVWRSNQHSVFGALAWNQSFLLSWSGEATSYGDQCSIFGVMGQSLIHVEPEFLPVVGGVCQKWALLWATQKKRESLDVLANPPGLIQQGASGWRSISLWALSMELVC